MTTNTVKTILLIGCPLDSGNNGVSALAYSIINKLFNTIPDCNIIIQHNSGQQKEVIFNSGEKEYRLETVFFHASDRLSERKGLKYLNFVSYLLAFSPLFIRKKLSSIFPLFSAIDRTDVVMDVSGGDSFTSIYGKDVFRNITTVKNIVVRLKKPLILLPQSYGPFHGHQQIEVVRKIFNHTEIIGCRDKEGENLVTGYLKKTSKAKIINSPDVAFSLQADIAEAETISNIILKKYGNKKLVIGLNVSGLLYSDKLDFSFEISYKKLVNEIIQWAIGEINAIVLLVPHVVSTRKKTKRGFVFENTDSYVTKLLYNSLNEGIQNDVLIAPEVEDPRKIKGIISNCDYFIGARMHACIAAISQSIPTSCLAYSDKFSGVMGMANVEGTVLDLRQLTNEQCLKQIRNRILNIDNMHDQFSLVNSKIQQEIDYFFHEVKKNIS